MAVVRETLGNGGLRPRHFRRELIERHHARVAPPFQANRPGLAEDVHGEYALGTRGGAQDPALLGEAFARLHVEVVLVAEAAEQAPAAARDLRRVERQVLILGERQAYGPELRQPARAAVLAAAPAHAVEPFGFVARPDLAQLDARVEQARQVPHQRAEVHALLGREVDRELLLVPLPLGIGDLHREIVLAHAIHHLAAHLLLI